jgi:hypothetical protein
MHVPARGLIIHASKVGLEPQRTVRSKGVKEITDAQGDFSGTVHLGALSDSTTLEFLSCTRASRRTLGKRS